MRGIVSPCALEGHRPGSIPGKDVDQVVDDEFLDYEFVLVVLKNCGMKCSTVVREEEYISQKSSKIDIQND
jgi:hypothetical protein